MSEAFVSQYQKYSIPEVQEAYGEFYGYCFWDKGCPVFACSGNARAFERAMKRMRGEELTEGELWWEKVQNSPEMRFLAAGFSEGSPDGT